MPIKDMSFHQVVASLDASLMGTVALHLSKLLNTASVAPLFSTAPTPVAPNIPMASDSPKPVNPPHWDWKPPSLSAGSAFQWRSMGQLQLAISLDKRKNAYKVGLEDLIMHHTNYTDAEPRSLSSLGNAGMICVWESL